MPPRPPNPNAERINALRRKMIEHQKQFQAAQRSALMVANRYSVELAKKDLGTLKGNYVAGPGPTSLGEPQLKSKNPVTKAFDWFRTTRPVKIFKKFVPAFEAHMTGAELVKAENVSNFQELADRAHERWSADMEKLHGELEKHALEWHKAREEIAELEPENREAIKAEAIPRISHEKKLHPELKSVPKDLFHPLIVPLGRSQELHPDLRRHEKDLLDYLHNGRVNDAKAVVQRAKTWHETNVARNWYEEEQK